GPIECHEPSSRAPGHFRTDSRGGGAGWETHLQTRIPMKAIAPQRTDAIDPGRFGIKFEEVHSTDRATGRSAWTPWAGTAARLSARCVPSDTRRSASRAPRVHLRRS